MIVIGSRLSVDFYAGRTTRVFQRIRHNGYKERYWSTISHEANTIGNDLASGDRRLTRLHDAHVFFEHIINRFFELRVLNQVAFLFRIVL